jgi:DNA sulfur modification protein DndD
LKGAKKKIDEQIATVGGDSDLKDLESALTEVETDIAKRTAAKEEIERDITTFTSQRDEIVQKLRESEGARQIQLLRDEKQKNLRQAEQDIATAQEEVLRWIGLRSIQVVSKKLSQETLDFIDEASLRGKIPSPYNEDFVRGLLKAEECICHRPLKPQSSEWSAVVDLLKSAGNAVVMSRVVQARARIQQIKEGAAEAPRSLQAAQERLAALVQRRNTLEQEIAEIGQKLEGLPLTEIAEREAARRTLEEKILGRYQFLGAEKQSIQLAESRKSDLEREIKRVGAKNEKARKLLRKRDLVMDGVELLRSSLDEYEKSARGVIQQKINEILEKVARRYYKCRFDEDFSLKLLFADGTPTPKSGGENQLFSLSFIASLIKFSELRSKASGEILLPGTIAPLAGC